MLDLQSLNWLLLKNMLASYCQGIHKILALHCTNTWNCQVNINCR